MWTVVDADAIRQLNAEYRDKDAVTDVLSFPMYEFLNGAAQEDLEAEPDSGCVMLGDMIFVLHARGRAGCAVRSFARAGVRLSDDAFRAAPAGYDHERNDEDTRLMRARKRTTSLSSA